MTHAPEQLWTVREFAEWLRVTTASARAMILRRKLPSDAVVRFGRRVRIRVAIVRAWVLERGAA